MPVVFKHLNSLNYGTEILLAIKYATNQYASVMRFEVLMAVNICMLYTETLILGEIFIIF
jgi:hypothetical protein